MSNKFLLCKATWQKAVMMNVALSWYIQMIATTTKMAMVIQQGLSSHEGH